MYICGILQEEFTPNFRNSRYLGIQGEYFPNRLDNQIRVIEERREFFECYSFTKRLHKQCPCFLTSSL